MITDIYKILRGREQVTKSQFGSWLKKFLERKLSHQEIRKLIHYGGEEMDGLHQAFN